MSLPSNQLTGPIPARFGDLASLQWLILRNNNLSGTIPDELENLDNLRSMILSGNGFSGCISEDLWGVPDNDLTDLGLPACGVEGTPVPTSDRSALVALYQATDGANWRSGGNWLTGMPIGQWLGVRTDNEGRVRELDLSWKGLQGRIPVVELSHLTNLTRLRLANNELSGEIPAELGSLTNIEELYLSGNQFSGCIPKDLQNLAVASQ